MKAKTVSSAKKKVVAKAKKKPAVLTKKKAATPAKKKTVVSAKKNASLVKNKAASPAKEKLELSKQVTDFVEASFKGRRMAYFVRDTERTKEGAFIVCVAVEDEPGYFKLDWGWHCSSARAKAETVLLNDKLGLTEEEVNEIIISTMGQTK
jgi:hypothetical protein